MHQNSFSPKARWDRFEPDKAGFNPDALNELPRKITGQA